MSVTPSAPPDATTTERGLMSAADKTKLDAQSGTNTGDVTVTSPAGWLSIVGQALTFALVSASGTVAGVVDIAAQTFAGVKTFLSTIIASAGIQVGALWNTNGTGASDVGVKVGVSTADASVNATATLLGVYAGLGGTEVQSFLFRKGGVVYGTSGNPNLALNDSIGAGLQYGASYCRVGNGSWSVGTINWSVWGNFLAINAVSAAEIYSGSSVPLVLRGGPGAGASDIAVKLGATLADGSVNDAATLVSIGTGVSGTYVEKARFLKTGRLDQKGNDRASTIGNDTQHNPSGINTIASGATSVTILNSLVPDPATKKIRLNLTWRGDPGSRWWWTQTTGAITINLSSPAPANVSCDWELAGLL